MAGGNGVERDAISQVLGVVEMPVLDPGAGLEGGEPGFDGTSGLVPVDDLLRVFGVWLAKVAQQQPLQRLLPLVGPRSVAETASIGVGIGCSAGFGASRTT